MIATKLPPIKLFLPPSKSPRSDGVHVSSIIRCIATETGILKPEFADELSLSDVREITDPVAILRMSIGLAWEQYFIPEILGPLLGVADHPGELELDGVYMTHDGESVSAITTEKGPKLCVHEVKATYKSSKTVGDLSTQFAWLSQCKAYCKALRTRWAMLHILYLCGDYSFPIKPCLDVWQIEFTQGELDDNWQLLTDYREQFEARVR